MTPPCLRCHGAPYTPALPEGWESPSSRCPAETRWVDAGGTGPAEGRALDSWVRSNFERARAESPPLRLDVAAARLQAEIRLRPGRRGFFPFPWGGSPYRAVEVDFSNARLRADWEVENNALLLGLRELVAIEGVHVDGPLSFNARPESLRVGNFGALHLIARTTPSALFLLDPFMVPRPPLGQELPTEEQWATCEARRAAEDEGIDAGADPCWVPLNYPNHRADPRIDRILTHFLPTEFLRNGRLSTRYGLEDLLGDLRAYLRNRAARPETPGNDPLALMEEWLAPGSHIDLEIQRLQDLFIPGLLDLGPSRGRVRLTYLGERRFRGVVENFEVQLDPSGYPVSSDGTRSPFELQNTYLYSSSRPASLDGEALAPGLRFEFDAARGELWVEANLGLHSDLRVPLWGDIEASGELALSSVWRIQNGEWRPLPGATRLEWRNGEIWEAGRGRPLFTGFELHVSDYNDPFDLFTPNLEGWRMRAEGVWGGKDSVHLELSLPLARDISGDYDFHSLLREIPAQLALHFIGRQSYHADLQLRRLDSQEHRQRFVAELNVAQGEGSRRRGIVEDVQLQVELQHSSEERDGMRIEMNAARFQALGLDLRQVGLRMDLERLSHQEGVTEVRIPSFRLEANPRGRSRGLLRGPAVIELLPARGRAMTLAWNGVERHLRLEDLDLRFNIQGIHLAPLQSETFRRVLNPRIAALGLDGHLEGSLTADLPVNRRAWRARGSLRLRGDRDGDVYFLDAAGRRVGPALVRDTRWRFSRVDRIDWNRRYALGRFHLDTLLNFSSLLPPFEAGPPEPAYGSRGQELRPFEIHGVMPYDNQPWDVTGFQNRIVDYLVTLCRRDARCREGRP